MGVRAELRILTNILLAKKGRGARLRVSCRNVPFQHAQCSPSLALASTSDGYSEAASCYYKQTVLTKKIIPLASRTGLGMRMYRGGSELVQCTPFWARSLYLKMAGPQCFAIDCTWSHLTHCYTSTTTKIGPPSAPGCSSGRVPDHNEKTPGALDTCSHS